LCIFLQTALLVKGFVSKHFTVIHLLYLAHVTNTIWFDLIQPLSLSLVPKTEKLCGCKQTQCCWIIQYMNHIMRTTDTEPSLISSAHSSPLPSHINTTRGLLDVVARGPQKCNSMTHRDIFALLSCIKVL
jgi:hypothetical protein